MSPEAGQPVLSRRGLRIAGMATAAVAAAVIITGVTTRKMADARLGAWTEKQATAAVVVIRPDSRERQATLDLPSRLEAYSQAQLFARVSGYIKEWQGDIGTPVKAGQLLAEIDAPDLDQQIMQAKANVGSAQANAALAAANLVRGQSLAPTGSISKQDLEQRTADATNKQGLANSAQADLDRMRVLEKYKRIVAPFDGLITSRATDIGALINAGSSGGPPLFVVSDVSKLRVYVNVPQSYVPSVKIGTKAQLTVPEYPGRTFTATVEASAQSVDAASGTTRMQLVVDNANGELMTGGFANLRLQLPSNSSMLSVPASALVFDQSGLRVATVGPDNKVVLKTVTIARDLGREVEIGAGLSADDRVIDSPPDGISAGDPVRVISEPAQPDTPAKRPAPAGTADAAPPSRAAQ